MQQQHPLFVLCDPLASETAKLFAIDELSDTCQARYAELRAKFGPSRALKKLAREYLA